MIDDWENERPRLLVIAHAISGNWQDAEDIVQEAALRWDEHAEVMNQSAWFTTVVSRIAIDYCRRRATQRQSYIGPWLPEVIVAPSAEDEALTHLDINLALLRLIQLLSPINRAVFVLAEIVGMSASEIAEITGITPAGVRQRIRRSKQHLASAGLEEPVTTASEYELAQLAGMLRAGDLNLFISELSEGAVLWTDSGGFSTAARRPIVGKAKVARFIEGIISKFGMPELHVMPVVGGFVLCAASIDMSRYITLETQNDLITGIQIQQNPNKIHFLPATKRGNQSWEM